MTDNQQKNTEEKNSNADAQEQLKSQGVGVSKDIIEKKHQEEVKSLNEKLLRMAAEIENLRKRNERNVSELKKYAIADFTKELTTVLENFFLIMDNAPHDVIAQNESFNNFFKGVEITHKDLTKLFEKNGIVRIYPMGEKFDHNLHQAVSQAESDQESGTIIQVVQAGYMYNDRLLKEALVVISK